MNFLALNYLLPTRKRFFRQFIRKIFSFINEPKYYLKELLKLIKSIITPIPKVAVVGNINDIFFLFDFQLSPQIAEMYTRIHQPRVIFVLKKILKPGEIFFDVGANIGYMSAYGAGLVGKKGEIHSFEPVPEYFALLSKLTDFNKYAVGDTKGFQDIKISNLSNIGWNSMVPGFMKPNTIKKIIEVPVIRLDNYIFKNNIERISLIKIDVEGYEYFVLRGLTNFFQKFKKKFTTNTCRNKSFSMFKIWIKSRRY